MIHPGKKHNFSRRAMHLILRKSLMVWLFFCIALSQAGAISNGLFINVVARETHKDAVVYITKSGKKYHKSSCRYLSNSKLKVSLKEAKKNGYEACKVCKP